MNTRRTLSAVVVMLVLAAAAPPALVPMINGPWLLLAKPAAVGTCDVSTVGAMVQQFGGASEGVSKLCFCKSDGAGTPAYAWASLTWSSGAAVVTAGGSSTVCP